MAKIFGLLLILLALPSCGYIWGNVTYYSKPSSPSCPVSYAWHTIVAAGFSAGGAGFTSIAIDSSGTPYVVYGDGGIRAIVMVYSCPP